MEKKELNIIIAVAVGVVIFLGFLGCSVAWFTLYRALKVQQAQLTEIQAELRASPLIAGFRPGQIHAPSTRTSFAAADSLEGKMRAQGKHWVQTPGEIIVGAYVEDTYENRQGQPEGRGGIGKVLSIAPDDQGVSTAQVDFSRGYVAGLHLSELSLIRFVP